MRGATTQRYPPSIVNTTPTEEPWISSDSSKRTESFGPQFWLGGLLIQMGIENNLPGPVPSTVISRTGDLSSIL